MIAIDLVRRTLLGMTPPPTTGKETGSGLRRPKVTRQELRQLFERELEMRSVSHLTRRRKCASQTKGDRP